MIKYKDDIEAHLPFLFKMLLDPVELAVRGELGLVRGEGGGVLSSRPHYSSIINLLAANVLYLRTDCTAWAQYRKFKTNIPREGNVGRQSQFIHSCVCERFTYSQDWSAYSVARKYVDRSLEYTYTRKSLTGT